MVRTLGYAVSILSTCSEDWVAWEGWLEACLAWREKSEKYSLHLGSFGHASVPLASLLSPLVLHGGVPGGMDGMVGLMFIFFSAVSSVKLPHTLD